MARVTIDFVRGDSSARNEADRLRRAIAELKSPAAASSRELQAMGRSADRTGRGFRDLERGIGRASRGAVAGSGMFRGFGRSIAFASAAFLGGAGLLSVLKTSISLSADQEVAQARVNVLFGKSASVVEGWSRRTASSIFLVSSESQALAANAGKMIESFGVAPAAAAKMSTALVDVAAKVAFVRNMDPAAVLKQFLVGMAGRALALRRLGIQIDSTRLTAEALRLGLIKLTVDSAKVEAAATRVAIAQAKSTAALANFGPNSTQAAEAGLKLTAAQEGLATALGGTTAKLNAAQKGIATASIIMRDTTADTTAFANAAGKGRGQIAEFHAQIKQLQEGLGGKGGLEGALLSVLKPTNEWLAKAENQRAAAETLKTAVVDLTAVVRGVLDVIVPIAKAADTAAAAFGGWKNVVQAMLTIKLASVLLGWGQAMTALIGVEAAGAAGTGLAGAAGVSGLLLAKLRALAAVGMTTIGVTMLYKSQGDRGAKGIFEGVVGGAATGGGVAALLGKSLARGAAAGAAISLAVKVTYSGQGDSGTKGFLERVFGTAALGAGAGSVVPGVGTSFGAIVGVVAGLGGEAGRAFMKALGQGAASGADDAAGVTLNAYQAALKRKQKGLPALPDNAAERKKLLAPLTEAFPIPAGVPFQKGGGPGAGTHAQPDWQSGNAVDIMTKPGTAVLSPVDGQVIKLTSGSATPNPQGGKVLFGDQITLLDANTGDQWFITHIRAVVGANESVTAGVTVLGYVINVGMASHAHVARSRGNILNLYDAPQVGGPGTGGAGTGAAKGGGQAASRTTQAAKGTGVGVSVAAAAKKYQLAGGSKSGVDAWNWARAFLEALGAPLTPDNVAFVVAWEGAEGTKAQFNPLATTRKAAGSRSAGLSQPSVQAYLSAQSGLKATVETLKSGAKGYDRIMQLLISGTATPEQLQQAVYDSVWGTWDKQGLKVGKKLAPRAPSTQVEDLIKGYKDLMIKLAEARLDPARLKVLQQMDAAVIKALTRKGLTKDQRLALLGERNQLESEIASIEDDRRTKLIDAATKARDKTAAALAAALEKVKGKKVLDFAFLPGLTPAPLVDAKAFKDQQVAARKAWRDHLLNLVAGMSEEIAAAKARLAQRPDLVSVLGVTPETIAAVAATIRKAQAAARQALRQAIAESQGEARTGKNLLAVLIGLDPAQQVETENALGQTVTTTVAKLIVGIQAALAKRNQGVREKNRQLVAEAEQDLQRLVPLGVAAVRAQQQKMVEALAASRSRVSAAFGSVLDAALGIFDKKTADLIAKARVVVTVLGRTFESAAGEPTPAETELANRAAARAEAALQRNLRDAQTRLEEARASGVGIVEAEQAVQDALDAIVEAGLQKRAEAERKAADAALAAQQKQIEEQRAIKRAEFQTEYQQVIAQWEARTITAQQARQRISVLLKAYGITDATDAQTAATLMQVTFTNAVAEMVAAINALAAAIKGGKTETQGLSTAAWEAVRAFKAAAVAAAELNAAAAAAAAAGVRAPAPPGKAEGGIIKAAGGYRVPGSPGAGDSVPALLTPGEIVFNRRQQLSIRQLLRYLIRQTSGAGYLRAISLANDLGINIGGGGTGGGGTGGGPTPFFQPVGGPPPDLRSKFKPPILLAKEKYEADFAKMKENRDKVARGWGITPEQAMAARSPNDPSVQQEQADGIWQWFQENATEEQKAQSDWYREHEPENRWPYILGIWWAWYAVTKLGYTPGQAVGPPPSLPLPSPDIGFARGGLVRAIRRFANGGIVGSEAFRPPPDLEPWWWDQWINQTAGGLGGATGGSNTDVAAAGGVSIPPISWNKLGGAAPPVRIPPGLLGGRRGGGGRLRGSQSQTMGGGQIVVINQTNIITGNTLFGSSPEMAERLGQIIRPTASRAIGLVKSTVVS